ncbi:MAG: hypothetical protein ACFCUI_02085 [Bernardetiaceae bacterium]
MKTTIEQRTEAFLKAEREAGAFAWTTATGQPYWSWLRNDLIHLLLRGGQAAPKTFKKDRPLQKALRLIRILTRWLSVLVTGPTERYRYLVVANSRMQNDQGVQYDVFLDDTLQKIAHQSLIIENYDNKGALPYLYPDHLLYLPLVLRPLFRDAWINRWIKEDFAELQDWLRAYYPEQSIDLLYLKRIYFWNYLDYYTYRLLVRRLKSKAIFFIKVGLPHGLLRAAREQSIPTLEVQHGMPYRYADPSAHWPQKLPEEQLPPIDYMLAFHRYLEKVNEYPHRKIVVIGNRILAKKKNISPQLRDQWQTLLVVHQVQTETSMEELVARFLVAHTGWQVIFKVKPDAFDDLERLRQHFKGESRIQLIAGERSMTDILDEVHAVLLTQSTAFYEALYRQVKCLVYRRSQYTMFRDHFDFPNVYLIDDIPDLTHALRQPTLALDEAQLAEFYQDFDAAALDQVLTEINSNTH